MSHRGHLGLGVARNIVRAGAHSRSCRGLLQVALLLTGCAALWGPGARAQGSRKDDIVFNSQGRPLAGATVRICTSAATGQPCTPLANIYSDPALTQALANPLSTDGLGNYTFYAAPGRYEVEISGPNITTKQMPNVILPNDPSSPTFTTLSTTSGISTFSLSLGGNLTVTGSAAVTGTLLVGGGPVPSTGQSNTWTAAQTFQGPSPWVDVAAYGAREIYPTNYSTSCTISSGSHSLTLAAAEQFMNGDGISCYGAGASNTMSTPGAPTVTPSVAAFATGTGVVANAPAGSASFSYKIVALGTWSSTSSSNLWGAYTAASAAGATTTGNSLGSQTVAISSLSEQGGLMTVTTSSANGLAAGSYVSIAGTSNDASFSGQFIVQSVADTTHFTVSTGNSTAGAVTATGGTAGWYVCNHVTWTAVTGAFEYAIYGRSSGSWTLLGFAWPGNTYWDDFGSPMMDNLNGYKWLPTTAPSSAQNGALTTTITAGGGTTSLTLAAAASSSISAGYATFDDVPGILAAETASRPGYAPVFIPPTTAGGYSFVVGSYLSTAPGGGSSIAFHHAGQLWLDAPMEWDSGIKWYGLFGGSEGTPSFTQETGSAIVVNTAFPGIWGNNINSGVVDNTQIGPSGSLNNNALLSLLQNGALFNWNNSNWSTSSNGTSDYMGVALAVQGLPNLTFDNDAWVGGPSQAPNLTTTPLVSVSNSILLSMKNSSFNRRAIAYVGNGANIHFEKGWLQGLITPLFMTNASYESFGGIYIGAPDIDTSSEPEFAAWGPPFSGTVQLNVGGVGAPPGLMVTGSPIANIVAQDVQLPSGQNHDSTSCFFAMTKPNIANANSSVGSACQFNGSTYSAQPNPRPFFIEQEPTAPASSLTAGGTLGVGTALTYQVNAIFPDNSTSAFSPAGNSVTPTTGNQTTTSTWAAVPGAVKYDVWRNGLGLDACHNITVLSCTDNGGFGFSTNPITAPSGGYPSMGPTGVYTPLVTVGGDAQFSASPRSTTTVFLPGTLSSTWTGGTLTLDKAVTVTRVQVQAKTAPVGCSTGAVVRLTDGTTPVNVTVSAAANDSGSITQNYAAAAVLTVAVQTAASGCSTSPADVNVIVQYRMQ